MTLETEVANLVAATTDLTAAVNVKKAALDASVSASAASQAAAAGSASAAQDKAIEAGSKATASAASATAAAASAAAAQTHANNAAAVVTGGTAALAPAGGKIPLADATGKIDLQWLGQDAAARISMIAQQINHIGTPGAVGFGVGICPTLTAGFTALAGTYALGSDEYGNYRYQDGSIMVWVPAFYYRIGHADAPNYARDGVNAVEIKPIQAFADRAAAAAAGFALHRAFIDGGEIVPGFMYDKYRCSNNGGIASSVKNAAPLSSAAAHNPFSGLNGAPSNTYGGAFVAAKTRGGQFFPASRFMRAALALLALAHGQAANTSASCAWFDAARVTNFPKGNNNNAFKDANDTSVTYTHDGYVSGNSGLTGSGVPFAKTTHNGQACGIADLNGNMYTIEPGLTCVATSKSITAATQANPVALTIAGHGLITGAVVMITGVVGMTQLNDRLFTATVVDANTLTLDGVDGTAFTAYTSGGSLTSGQFYIAKEATKFKNFTGGATLATDHFGATGVAAMMEPFAFPFRTDYPNNGVAQKLGNAANQVLAPATSGAGWQLAGLGLPKAMGASTAGSSMFGQDYFYQYIRNELCPISGMHWDRGANAGPWAVYLNGHRSNSDGYAGFCAASYPVRPSGNEA
ncbi:ubiquitin-activating E1 FCCH domain-containing protein [Pseudomonas sp. AN-1]|uniref:ubiquitin-activating E1 FCCH domain-containing protein n=1 Tax=Pseudomonas sp. AN-1 TaxID=3096605 RepID=UPI002A69B0B5|nr:ubiquitin-activating E1 FCCH domain-containing protein [Pseudomonas sp. AN-1]WPP47704.1 ubiquitin-activating E1 FCCH domain-containing protein [Pseudomonas sp. AN-1]